MGAAYWAMGIGFLFGLFTALSPDTVWHRRYGRMIEGAKPTAEGLALIRRSGIVLMVFSVLMAVFLAWFQIKTDRETQRVRESIKRGDYDHIFRPPGLPLDQPDGQPARP
jgi:hypothetical protein